MRDSLEILLRSRPLVPAAVLLILGIVAGRVLEVGVEAGLGMLGVAVALVAIGRGRPLRWAGVAIGLLALGAVLYSARYRITTGDDARLVFPLEPKLVELRGRIDETPALRDYPSGSNNVVYSHATVQLTAFLQDGKWHPVSGTVAARARGELSSDFWEGRTVQITGVVEEPPGAMAEGLFDYREYLRNLRIFRQVRSDSTNDWQLLSLEAMPITEKFRRWAKRQLQRGLPENDENVQMIWAMTLGIKRALNGEASEPFMKTGTMHIFAVSGLHVACIAGFLLYLLQIGGASRAMGGFITVPVIWFYTLATGWQSSAIRSALMFTVIIAGRMIQRPSDLLNSTAAAAIIILIFQPEQLFQAGFQLSFAVVASLGLFVPPLMKFKPPFVEPDPFLPESMMPQWKKLARPVWRIGSTMMAVSIAAWIGSTPVVAYYFNIVTLNSVVANLVAVPLSSVSLAATVLSLLVAPLGALFNYFAWSFMAYTIAFTEFLASFRSGFLYLPKPNPAFFLFYYGAALSVPIALSASIRQRIWLGAVVSVLGVCWGLSLAGRPAAKITVLPCAGTPAFFTANRGPDLLIDASSERDAENMVKRFLRGQGLGSIDRLLLTHGDAQTAGGFDVVWNEFSPEFVITSGTRARSPVYRRVLRHLEARPDRWRVASAGSEEAGWEVLHPPKGKGFPRADDNCMVLKRRIEHWTVLHLSELGREGQRQLLENAPDLRADILIAGMPEQGEAVGAEVLEAVKPRVIILGTSRYPYTAAGSPELRARLESSGAEVFYTDERTAISVIIRPESCEIRTMEGRVVKVAKES